ncbi:MAG TPA: hypothetical protein VNA16_01875, partial [Abditibacteriaceae bacterium]|nr:hypothetical protein [Abditibacteriaceae bacterium]
VVEPFSPQYLSYSVLRLRKSQGGFARELVLNRDLYESNPRWSGDGKFIAFQAEQIHTHVDAVGRAREVHLNGIWIVGSDGRGLRRIVNEASLITWLH